MSAIDVQNAKQIRDPMIISCGIAARVSADLTVTAESGTYLCDYNLSESIDSEEWPIRALADLQGEGFPADGSCVFWSSSYDTADEDGKIGAISHVGGSFSLTISAAVEIPALTIYTSGAGTITAGGTTYEARGVNVIAVNATSVTLTFASTDAERRIEVLSITPGINMSWDNDTLISVELDLRSDLSIKDSQWAVSEIQVEAYYPDDISEAISNMSDDVPIWYTAGYSGDMSRQRQFYLSEPATMENNIITIKGYDASHKLGEKSNSAQVLNTVTGSGKNSLYGRFVNLIRNAGITIQRGVTYPTRTSSGTAYSLVFKEATSDTLVRDIMNLCRLDSFWPTFVDAGIPTVSWAKPTSKWDIYEEDCGSIVREVDRNIAKITTDDDYGLHTRCVRATSLQELTRKNVEAFTRYSHAPGGYWWQFSVSNAYDITTTADKVAWNAERTSYTVISTEVRNGAVKSTTEYVDQSVVKGKSITVTREASTVRPTTARVGSTLEVSPNAYGKVYEGSTLLYPNYRRLFERSNITGSFTWKGDPRMQPRDVFTFHRLDGTTEECTIESIVLKHDGGTTAEIAYRKGVC